MGTFNVGVGDKFDQTATKAGRDVWLLERLRESVRQFPPADAKLSPADPIRVSL